MAVEIVVPKLGWTAEEATLVEWKKADGEWVQPGDVYLLVEGDKAVNEVEAFEAGILRLLPNGPKIGETVPVGTLLGYFLQKGEAAPWDAQTQSSATRKTEAESQRPAPAAPDTASATQGQVPTAGAVPQRQRISPRARKIARELGVDASALTGSGVSGRVVAADVMAAGTRATDAKTQAMDGALQPATGQQPPTTSHRPPTTGQQPPTTSHRPPATSQQPPGATRKTIAARMAASAHTAAPVTLHTEADATELVKLRDAVKRDRPAEAPSYNDLFAKICAYALGEHPALNASWANDAVQPNAQAHIGMAVQTDRGLLVPVVRDPAGKSLAAIAADSARLIERARAGTLSAGEMQGGTFTITNLGAYDIDGFTPIINLPECAILGIGRIAPRLIVIDEAAEKTAIRKMMTLSLTFDHRVVDGAPAAAFLKRVKQYVEQPYLWLTRQ